MTDHRLTERLQSYGSAYTAFGRRFARWAGLHSTDGEALMEIVFAEERGQPLSPSRLADRVQLTSGATTSLIDRLERAGHVVRSREGADRRTVTLRTGPKVHEMADEFFGPLGARLDAIVGRYPAETVAQFESLLDELTRTIRAEADR